MTTGLTYRDEEPHRLLRSDDNYQLTEIGSTRKYLARTPTGTGRIYKLHKEKPPGGFKPAPCRKQKHHLTDEMKNISDIQMRLRFST